MTTAETRRGKPEQRYSGVFEPLPSVPAATTEEHELTSGQAVVELNVAMARNEGFVDDPIDEVMHLPRYFVIVPAIAASALSALGQQPPDAPSSASQPAPAIERWVR